MIGKTVERNDRKKPIVIKLNTEAAVRQEHPLDAQIQNRDDAVRLVLGKAFTEEELAEITVPEVEDFVNNCHLGPEDKVLEIGSGVGRFASIMSPIVNSYTGIDISGEMVRVARERTSDFPNVEFFQSNGCDLRQFEDGSFSFIFCTIAFIHMDVEDVFNYLLEAHRCLAKGGRVYFDFLNLWDDRVRDKWCAAYTLPREPKTGEKDIYRTRYMTPDEVRLYLREAGFLIDRMVLDILIRAYGVKDGERPYDGVFKEEAETNREQRLLQMSEELASIYGSRAYRLARWIGRVLGT